MTDELMGNPATWALGYSIGRLGSTAEETPTVFGMPGVGGSVAWADKGAGVTFALTKNRYSMTQSDTAVQIGNSLPNPWGSSYGTRTCC